jgi:hypothetical protein
LPLLRPNVRAATSGSSFTSLNANRKSNSTAQAPLWREHEWLQLASRRGPCPPLTNVGNRTPVTQDIWPNSQPPWLHPTMCCCSHAMTVLDVKPTCPPWPIHKVWFVVGFCVHPHPPNLTHQNAAARPPRGPGGYREAVLPLT